MRTRRQYLVVMFALWLAVSPARAQRADESPEQTARALVVAGEQAWKRKDYAGAVDKYRRAYALSAQPKLHYNIGIALAELGRDADAVNELDAFLREADDAPVEYRDHAARLIAQRANRLARLEVVTDHAGGAEIAVDGTRVGLAPVTWRVWPGDHEITASAKGRRVGRARVTIAAGETRRVSVTPSPIDLSVRATDRADGVGLDSQPRDEPPETRSLLSRWWFWTIVGSAIVATSVGVYFATRGDCPDDSGSSLGSVCPFSE